MRAKAMIGGVGGLCAAALAAWLLLDTPGVLVEDVIAAPDGTGGLAVTMTLRNGGAPDRLLAVRAPDAGTAALVSQDAEVLPIPGQAEVSLSVDGAYIALSDVAGPLETGRLIPLSLTFEHAGAVAAKARLDMALSGPHRAMGADGAGVEVEPAPSVSLSATPRGDAGWSLAVNVENFTFSREGVDGPPVPGYGHAHLYVGGVKITRLYEPSAELPALPPGAHVVRVTLNTNDHQTCLADGRPVTATVVVGEE